jgi:hypothetical protein
VTKKSSERFADDLNGYFSLILACKFSEKQEIEKFFQIKFSVKIYDKIKISMQDGFTL